jgi:hypothetical protein
MHAIYGYYCQAKKAFLPYHWEKEARLEKYCVHSVYLSHIPIYQICIYRLDPAKQLDKRMQVRYIAVDEDRALKLHYKAVQEAVDMETGRRPFETFNWQMSELP